MRAKDEEGRTLPPPHQRLEDAAALEQAGIFALAQDGRAVALPLSRKLTLVRKVIDHVVDGDSVPKWVTKKDGSDSGNHALLDFWRLAEGAVRTARKAAA